MTVDFTDLSVGTVTNRFWDFGDGATTNTTATNLMHLYTTASTNTVMLTVTGPVGSNTLVYTNYIQVTNPPPLMVLNPTNLSFGALVVGQSNALNIQVSNGGARPDWISLHSFSIHNRERQPLRHSSGTNWHRSSCFQSHQRSRLQQRDHFPEQRRQKH
jgi:PKD repeat protein